MIFRESGDRFPECCDADGDGFGTLTRSPLGAMTIFHGATIDQIGTGDVLILHATAGGAPVDSATTVGFAFATPAVVAGYDDGLGTVATLTYPIDTRTFEPLPLRAGPAGGVRLTLSLWRPQRERIAGEAGSGKWVDVGNLLYALVLGVEGRAVPPGGCPAGTMTTADPDVELIEGQTLPFAPAIRDRAGDQPQDPANRLTVTLNISDCLAAKGVSPATLAQGDLLSVNVMATAQTPSAGPGQPAPPPSGASQVVVTFKVHD
jgi:hypothetical protein